MCHHCPGRCSGEAAISAAETLALSTAKVEGSDALGASAFADRLHASLLVSSTVYTSRFSVADHSGDAYKDRVMVLSRLRSQLSQCLVRHFSRVGMVKTLSLD